MSTFNEINHFRSETVNSATSFGSTVHESGTWSSNMGTLRTMPPELTMQGSPFGMLTSPTSENGNVSEVPRPVSGTLPPQNLHRTLVLCFDGTGDQFDSDNSNIVELFSMLKKDDPDKQLVYYQAGIGTYTPPEIATPLVSKISKTLDMMVAWNIDAHIMSGYEFLMQNYRAGDKICIFGFSRGAYTARCLAGMIHKVGLLPTCNHQQVPFAYKMYTRCDHEGWHQSNAFKKAFAIDVDIEFLGVWETVNSVGLIPRHLPFTTSNSVVKTFRHALALDERRAKFKANHWNRPTEEEINLSLSDRQKRALAKKEKEETNGAHKHSKERSKETAKDIERMENKHSKRLFETDVEEVWFSGCHCDIGGGSVTNGEIPCLARIPLRWMIRECFKAKTGILFYVDGIKGINLDPACLYPEVLSRPPALPLNTFAPGESVIQRIPKKVSAAPECHDDDDDDAQYLPAELTQTEEEADLKDALAPIYDQLSLAPHWWVLELLPIRQRYQDTLKKREGETDAQAELENWVWHEKIRCNLGEGRHIPKQRSKGVKIHRTVKTRMEAAYDNGQQYKPAVNNLALDCVTWVD
ncbi:hypothetical protein D9619_013150 [Psilocybe cf. subviscida]|uniref:T6SS Phospholipase effector Tle1-like catalytic domain-containing protein n=1 Tax=Psilocybe cf. subviscida TaxID=2480587 RepID=A0A8H5EZ87_9AGAR|nr:hypothetical protein D9619_013150 [Psilocybe cf. subviscida]